MKEYPSKSIGPNGETITRMIPVKTCPFCGADAEMKDSGASSLVGCFNKFCTVHPKAKSTEGIFALKRWNTRTTQK